MGKKHNMKKNVLVQENRNVKKTHANNIYTNNYGYQLVRVHKGRYTLKTEQKIVYSYYYIKMYRLKCTF